MLVPKPTTRTLVELSSNKLSSHKQAFVGGARDKPKDRPRRRLIVFTLVSMGKALHWNEVEYNELTNTISGDRYFQQISHHFEIG